jgi:hypothetical protein
MGIDKYLAVELFLRRLFVEVEEGGGRRQLGEGVGLAR